MTTKMTTAIAIKPAMANRIPRNGVNCQYLAPLIWAALGGKETLEKCLGARDFTECSNAVYFKVRPEGKINAIRIVTDGNGLFTLQYMHVYSDVKAGIGGESRTNWADEINTMKRICADEMVFRIDAVFCPIIENSLMYAIVDSAPIADEPVLVVHEQAPEGYEIPAKIDNEPEIILDSEPEKSDIVDKETTNTRTDNMPEHEPIPPQISAKARALADEYFDLTGGKYFVVLASVPASEFIPASECERPKGVKPVIVKGVEYFHIDDFPPAPKPAKKARAAKPELTVEILPIHKQILKAITDGNDTPELLAGYLFLPTDKLENELREMAKFALIETIEGKLIKV